jgi:4,5-dihydroxyphthalate decarboxylase
MEDDVNELQAFLGAYPHTETLFRPDEPRAATDRHDFSLTFRSMGDLPGAFNRMANGREFDICEMPIVSYLVAKDCGIKITAIPAFVTRGFDHRRLFLSVASGVQGPKDLEGRSVGVRYYGFTDGTWARAVLAATFGVDLDRITWITAVPETVLAAQLPPNVRYANGADPVAMFESGELAGLIMNAGQDLENPVATPLFDNPVAAELAWFRKTAVYPIHHTVVVRDELLEEFPDLAPRLMDELIAGKQHLLDRLGSGDPLGAEEQALAATRDFMGEDPLPYGVEPNRAVLEMITRVALDQHLITEPLSVEDAFPSF